MQISEFYLPEREYKERIYEMSVTENTYGNLILFVVSTQSIIRINKPVTPKEEPLFESQSRDSFCVFQRSFTK